VGVQELPSSQIVFVNLKLFLKIKSYIFLKSSSGQSLITHVYNLSNLGAWDWEDSDSRPVQANSL
jgi:hypothetical protein